MLALIAGFAWASPARADDPSAAARTQLIGLLQSVPAAPASSYVTRDSTGQPLGPIKIIDRPGGGYLGVYHVGSGTSFAVRVATSTDLVRWNYSKMLARNASQPTIAALANGGFVVALEKYRPSLLGLTPATGHLEFLFYPTVGDLLAGRHRQRFDAPHTLSTGFEGTPSIRATSLGPPPRRLLGLLPGAPMGNSSIQVGFHYLDTAAGVDRNATGVLNNFSSWSTRPNTQLNGAFGPSIGGSIGGRDHVDFQGYPFTVVEAESVKNDFGTWRLYLFDETAGTLTALTPVTPGGSVSLGNPRLSVVTDPAGRRALAVSLFVFGSGAGPGEAGELIYYNEF